MKSKSKIDSKKTAALADRAARKKIDRDHRIANGVVVTLLIAAATILCLAIWVAIW